MIQSKARYDLDLPLKKLSGSLPQITRQMNFIEIVLATEMP